MADLLERAAKWLAEKQRPFASRPVVYQRGSESVPVLASIGRTVFQVDDGAGALIQVQSRDYLIAAADLAMDGTAILPQRGDRIVETDGGQQFTHEVIAPGQEPCWRYSDPYRTTLRIHSKLIATE